MKNLIPILSIMLLTVCSSYANSKSPNPVNDVFEIRCIMKDHEKKLKDAEVVIYKEGQIFLTLNTTNGKLDVNLPKGSHYLLVFKSDKHFSKRIAVNTELEASDEEVPRLDLTMTLVPKDLEYLAKEDQDLLDFPVAYLAYDPNKGIYFDKNEQFSNVLLKDIQKKSKQYQLDMTELSLN